MNYNINKFIVNCHPLKSLQNYEPNSKYFFKFHNIPFFINYIQKFTYIILFYYFIIYYKNISK
jgi:hypothetical protein